MPTTKFFAFFSLYTGVPVEEAQKVRVPDCSPETFKSSGTLNCVPTGTELMKSFGSAFINNSNTFHKTLLIFNDWTNKFPTTSAVTIILWEPLLVMVIAGPLIE